LKKLKKGLIEIYGEQVDRILLYGSRARGDENPDSDIEIWLFLRMISTIVKCFALALIWRHLYRLKTTL